MTVRSYAGWQVQPGLKTVQGTLASAIGRLTGENVLPQGSGRTDAGVHALAQVATFATASPIPLENWVVALNHILPTSIRVLEVNEAAEDFHARKSARAKTYRYRIYRGAICPPFLARYVWHYPYPLDEAAMTAAASVVVGEHDFTSFAAVDPERVERMRREAGEGRDRARNSHPSQHARRVGPPRWEWTHCCRDECRVSFFFVMDARGRGIRVCRARERVSSSHGAKSGGHVSAGGEGNREPAGF